MKMLFLLAIAYMLIGCGARQVEYVDRPVEVKIPVQCTLEAPKRPILEPGFEGVKTLSIYADSLECTVALCRGEPCKIK